MHFDLLPGLASAPVPALISQYCNPEEVFTPSPVALVGPLAGRRVTGFFAVVWPLRERTLANAKRTSTECFFMDSSKRRCDYSRAITSISTRTSLGSRATSTVDRAGGELLKYLPYTSFIAVNSDMFLRKTVARTTFPRPLPAASRISDRLRSTRSVWVATPP